MAEGLTFTVAGSGQLGDVEPGWSEQEFATPVNPNERAGGTGTVSFAAKDVAAGVLAINKAITSEDGALGQVSGVVRTASKTGQRVAITHDNKLAKYNAVRTMPPMIAASVPGALDLAEQILGSPGFDAGSTGSQNSGGHYWSLFGHSYGVNAGGNAAEVVMENFSYQQYDPATATYAGLNRNLYFNTLSASNFSALGNNLYANSVTGDNFVLRQAQGLFTGLQFADVKFVLMGKSMLNSNNLVFTITGQPSGPADGDYNVPITVTINPGTGNLTIAAEYRSGGVRSNFSSTTSLASLNLTQEIAFRVYISSKPTAAIPYFPLVITVGVANTSNYSTVVTGTLNATPDLMPLWYDPWAISGNVRALWRRNDLITAGDIETWPVGERQDWEAARDYAFNGTLLSGQPSVGYTGQVWDWLQDACSAYFWEVGLDSDVITARPVGQVEMDVANYGASPTLTPTTTRTGRSVDIVWQNAVAVNSAEVYDARADDNRILSVGAAQETVTKIQTEAYLTSVIQPTRVTTFVPGAGTYYVIDSTGLPIVEDQWEDYGGALSVAIDNAEAGTIVITLTGPREQIPSTTAPYSLAVSDGQNQYAALSTLGSGVVADPQTLNLLTGADPSITPQDVAFTVDNAFINTLEQAYDAGIWAAVDASGPRTTYNIDVPTVAVTGFGDAAGSLIQAETSTYRVVDATVGRTSTSVTAIRHATVGTFDDFWSGQTVDEHDAFWGTYLCEDQRVLPYLGA